MNNVGRRINGLCQPIANRILSIVHFPLSITKSPLSIIHCQLSIIALLLLASCSTRSGWFRIEGHFLHMNQGQLLVYSTDGTVNGIDTIKVSGGRFSYEIPCQKPTTLMLVFPNFSEQPVFAESGKSIDIKADASHLKMMEITGTKDNELMTDFRKQTEKMAPPDVAHHAELFIGDHLSSPVCEYLLRRYFVMAMKPDLAKANKLLEKMIGVQKENGRLLQLRNDIKSMQGNATGIRLPDFSAEGINGLTANSSDLKGRVAVISTCATWAYESMNQLRQLKKKRRDMGNAFNVVTISLEGSADQIRRSTQHDSIPWPIVCDEKMFESPLVSKLGLYRVPGNILINKQGHVVDRDLDTQELLKKIEEMAKN